MEIEDGRKVWVENLGIWLYHIFPVAKSINIQKDSQVLYDFFKNKKGRKFVR